MEYIKKTLDFSDIGAESFICTEPTMYEILWNGIKYEFCVNYKADSKNAVIFAPGEVSLDSRNSFPVFSRIAWASDISCTGIWFFDPTLYLNDNLKVGWGYGTNDRWYLKDIAVIIEIILEKLNIPTKNALCYGSSAGGFMSVILATMLRSKASVTNAQFSLRDYIASQFENLEKAVLKNGESIIEERVNVTEFMKNENFVPLIHIVDNALSAGDIFNQLSALTHGIYNFKLNCADRITIDFFYDEKGHNGMPSKSARIKTIENDLAKCSSIDVELAASVEKGRVTADVKTNPVLDNMEFRYTLYNADRSKVYHQTRFINDTSHSFRLTGTDDYNVDVIARYTNPGNGVVVSSSAYADFRYEVHIKITTEQKLVQNKFTVNVDTDSANEYTTYACELYSADTQSVVSKIAYQSEPVFEFALEDSGNYYAKVFVSTKDDESADTVCAAADTEQIRYFSPSMKVGSRKTK